MQTNLLKIFFTFSLLFVFTFSIYSQEQYPDKIEHYIENTAILEHLKNIPEEKRDEYLKKYFRHPNKYEYLIRNGKDYLIPQMFNAPNDGYMSNYTYSQNDQWINYTNGDLILALAEEGNYMWVGTTGGLIQIDKATGGATFYNSGNSGLPGNYVSSIAIDRSGNKWIGTGGEGLARFDGENWTVYNTSNSGLPNNRLWSIAIDGIGNRSWELSGDQIQRFLLFQWNTPFGESEMVTFPVDMRAQMLAGNFDPGRGDRVYVRGEFNGWTQTDTLYEDLDVEGWYEKEIEVTAGVGQKVAYKYFMEAGDGSLMPNGGWEFGANRTFTFTGEAIVLERRFWSDITLEEFLQYEISGTVTYYGEGLGDVTITASGDYEQTVLTDENGAYLITDVPHGLYVTITPSKEGYSFTPPYSSIENISENTANIDFTGTRDTYTLSGMVTENDEGLRGVTITLSGDYSQTVETYGNGEYQITEVPHGSDVTITPSKEGYSFSLPFRSIENISENTTDIDFTGKRDTYTISGTVTENDEGLASVTITASGDYSQTVETDVNGEYQITEVPHGSDITITPSKEGYSFSPPSRSIENISENTTNIDFTGTRDTTYTISGTVTEDGDVLDDVMVISSNEHIDTVWTDVNGIYAITGVLHGSDVTITPSKEGYSFSPPYRSIENISENTTHIDFTGTRDTYTISGTVTENEEGFGGVTLIVSGEYEQTVQSGEDGRYQITGVPHGANIAITPAKEGYSFNPQSMSIENISQDTSGIDFIVKYLHIVNPVSISAWRAGSTYNILWDSDGIDVIKLEYSLNNGAAWQMLSSNVDASTGNYEWTLPNTTSSECLLRISGMYDESVEILSEPFTIYSSNFNISYNRTFADPTATISARMIGFPGNIDIPLSSILKGEQNKDWKAAWDNGRPTNYLVEYDGSSRFNLKPGRGFWIISKNSISVHQEEETVNTHDGQTYAIPLHSGWNIISNPFDKSVQWEAVQIVNNIQTDPLWTFNGSYRQSTIFEPYVGYYFYNRNNLESLKIPYNDSAYLSKRTDKSIVSRKKMTIGIVDDTGLLSMVEIIHLPEEQEDVSLYNQYAPPGNYQEVQMLLRQHDVDGRSGELLREVRLESREGEMYHLQVRSNENQYVSFSIDGLDEFIEYKVYLVDRRTGRFYDLHQMQGINISVEKGENEFSVLIGDDSYIDEKCEELLPQVFTLYQNYPNPFNSMTTIEYAVPVSENEVNVVLEVYNVLGQQVSVLVNESHEAGLYRATFDGGNLPSGMYIYRLRAGDFIESKRFILLK